MEDPILAVRPDFTSQEHEASWRQLVEEGLSNENAARALAALWTLANNAEKDCWALRQQHMIEARQREEDKEEEHQQQCKEEEEAAHLEERKKNKTKYAPIMKSGDYCELHYFTNRGLEDAKLSNLIAELEAMVMLPAADGLHSWIPAVAVKDPKAAPVVKDENLSWEEFNEATPRMITMMQLYDWPDDQTDMHIQFWSALQTHRWRHSPDQLKQRALLLYQSQQQ
ncbi:uncharacterized protein F5891DRAFT_955796 [Suillus fuscotomentosus]|uniref:Uncharacterized protein n=1 Tax=Suillus fuscotomentosus TaxID=1912939 RepID=A0AAD4E245_9AGAM|nr:uncharacterized protein F5891DRAFT_955796 [Suillus fuscotomentosus]KAG1898296.1 hypothetical protein F5891DRAFT_955796 [Suillus fuscotomentosus]